MLPIHADTYANHWEPNPANFTVNNAYHDENGDLLFYISDSKVYDFEGRFIGTLMITQEEILGPSSGTGLDIHGFKEIAIMPDKCNPNVFYIIAGNRDFNGHSSGESFVDDPRYTKLEIGLDINTTVADGTTQNINDVYGDPLADGRLGFANDYFTFTDEQSFLPYTGAPMHKLIATALAGQGQNEPAYTFAVSKVQDDGKRLLFVGAGPEVSVFTNTELAIAGNLGQLNVPNFIYSNIQSGNQNPNVECELFQAIGTNVIRMANRFPTLNKYFYTDFTYALGAIIPSSIQLLSTPGTTIDYGLEFSSNGRYLYFTNNTGLAYFDLNQIAPVAISLGVNISNFNTSQIEVGKDDALYFCNGTALGRLTNINNPTSITQINFTTINLPYPVAPVATVFNNAADPKLNTFIYCFNDQVDGEPPYPVIPVGNTLEEAKCCIERKRYNAILYNVGTAIDAVFGAQNHNQVWSPGALNNPFKSVNGVVAIKDRLIIPAGYTITINNMTFEYKIFLNDPNNSTVLAPFIDGAKCILMKSNSSDNGGVLILNNTVFKSLGTCIGMWDGIEVQGDPTAVQQTITTNPLLIKSHQAKLIVNSGSTIQDAYFGASNYDFDLTNGTGAGIFHYNASLSSGGIIIANNATFKNNFIGTCFLNYSAANVMSKFTKTNFLVDAALNNPLIAPNSMATIVGIKNLLFTGCNFKNLVPTVYPIVPSNGTGLIGIISMDASFTVKGGVAIGVPYGTGCYFENLGYGIRAWNSTANTVLIQSSVFKNNWRGSYFGNFSGTSVTKVQRNKYFVYEQPSSTQAIDAAYGHYLDYCNNFIVQENNFYYNSYNDVTGALVGGVFNAYGCIVNEENPNQLCEAGDNYKGDRVYKNLFKEIKFGAQAQGFNSERPNNLKLQTAPCHGGNTSIEHNQGLKYVCNTFSGTDENDITVMTDGAPTVPNPGRIAYQQGGGSQVAGNVLSHLTGLCNTFNPSNSHELFIDKTGIGNVNPNYLNYTSKNSAAEQLFCFSPYAASVPGVPDFDLPNTGVISTPIAATNLCLSQINILHSTGNVIAHRQMGKLISDLAQKLTGGDAEILITLINTATSGQIKTGLLDKSPYLSDRVLIAAIHKNLPDLIIREILMANSPVTEKVKQAIDVSTISIGVKNQVKAQNGQSERANLEAQITQLKDEQHVYEIESYYTSQTDSLINNTDSLISLIDYIGGNDVIHKKVKAHLSKNDLVKANQELTIMATNLGTSHPDYQYLHTMSDVYNTYNKGALGIINDASALSVVEATSQRTTEYDSKGALGIKEFLRLTTYREWIQGKTNTSMQRLGNTSEDSEETSVIENAYFKIYPNPSTGIFHYNYLTDTKDFANAQLEVHDMRGQLIISGSLNSSNANGMFDLSTMSNGMYFVKIATASKILFNSKINVVK